MNSDQPQNKPGNKPAARNFISPQEARGDNWIRFDLPAGATLEDIEALLEQLKALSKADTPKPPQEVK